MPSLPKPSKCTFSEAKTDSGSRVHVVVLENWNHGSLAKRQKDSDFTLASQQISTTYGSDSYSGTSSLCFYFEFVSPRSLVLKNPQYQSTQWNLVTWKTGEILHMSMRPEPRYCPVERKKVRRGIPKQRDSRRNWTRLSSNAYDEDEGLLELGRDHII